MRDPNHLRDSGFGGPPLDGKRAAAGDPPLNAESDWLSDYDFELPSARIAREPAEPRGSSRLFVAGRHEDEVVHDRFEQIGNHLRPGDLLVFNETRVLPARLFAKLERTGREMEILLSHPASAESVEATDGDDWFAMLGPSRRLRSGDRLCLTETDGTFEVVERAEGPLWQIRPAGDPRDKVRDWMASAGHLPLPPYLERADRSEDETWYQTVFARQEGAVAAPTAGLHFTEELIAQLEAGGVRTARVVLHVGPGTFLPVRAHSIEKHRVLRERFEVGEHAAAAIRAARHDEGCVVAVGTTVVRALESWAQLHGDIDHSASTADAAAVGWADLTITPGYEFRVVDALVTNFHLPRSSLLLLVAAFATRRRVLSYYETAIAEQYRFYSYGDAMFLR